MFESWIMLLYFSGPFLYLLGRASSDWNNVTDKRLISSLIRETGNNCTVEVKVNFYEIKGAVIEFGTQGLSKSYTAIAEVSFQESNMTTKDFK